MSKPSKPKARDTKKLFGLRLDSRLMLEMQHMALEHDRYVNECVEEAMNDFLDKYHWSRKGKAR